LGLLGQELGQAARGKKNRARQQTKRGRKDRARAVSAQQLDDESAAKVGLCHRTGSEKNPFRFIEVSANAVPAHAAHGDLVACPGAGVIDSETCTCVCPLSDEDDCTGNFVVDEDLCACVCPLTEADCPGGVDLEACACIVSCPCLSGCGVPPPGSICGCLQSTEGQEFCANNASCAQLPACTSSTTCPPGWMCVHNSPCQGNCGSVCAPPCGVVAVAGAGFAGEEIGVTLLG
jgi:hypothetical protein